MADSFDGEASAAAERYAQAAFELARDAKSLDSLEQDFAKLRAAWAESAELRDVARSPLIDPQEKAKALVAVAAKLGLSELGRNIVGLVAKNGRAVDIPGIITAFGARLAKHRGASQVEVISAKPLDPKQLDSILAGVSKALGGKVDAVTRVDESLIGGFVVRAGSRQFDASLKSKLDSLKLALKTA